MKIGLKFIVFTILFYFSTVVGAQNKSNDDLYFSSLSKSVFEKLNSNRIEDCISLVNECMKLYPNDGYCYYLRGTVIGLNQHNEEKILGAIKDFNKAEQLGFKTEHLNLFRADLYYRILKYDKAIVDYSEFINIHEDNLDAYLNRANCYCKTDNYNIAIENYFRVLQLSRWDKYKHLTKYDISSFYYTISECHLKHGIYFDAIRNVNYALDINPENYAFYKLKGEIYYNMDSFDLALESINTAIKFSTNNSSLFYWKGLIYLKANNPSKALEEFNTSAAMSGKYVSGYLYYNRALAKIMLDDYESACTDLRYAGERTVKEVYPLIKLYCK